MSVEEQPGLPIEVGEKETGRLEAFSDGVFAVAITLLVLDVKVPPLDQLPKGQGLAQALQNQWPAYLGYFTSFLTILIMWVNHHNLFKQIKYVDHTFLLLNGFLLLVVTTIPFPTSLVVAYIQQPSDQGIAAMVYCGTNFFLAVAFFSLWLYASSGNRLLAKNADPKTVRNITNQYRFGPILYVVSFVLAFINGWLGVGLCMLLAIFFALPSSVVETVSHAKKDLTESEE